MPLSDLPVRQAKAKKKDRTLLDYDGLVLFVPVKGRKAWHFRYRWLGKQSRLSLGRYPELSLRDARAMRDEARRQIAKGTNPRIARKQKQQAADLDRGLWLIPVASLKQHKMLIRRKRVRVDDLPPYIVLLSTQAQAIVRQMLSDFKPAQKYLFASVVRLTDRMSEDTISFALKRMGYGGRLTGHARARRCQRR